jgi:hypothetical protein
VQAVHSRKNADTGIISRYDFGNFTTPDKADRDAMLKVLLDYDEKGEPQLFLVPAKASKEAGLEAGGYGCYCLTDNCEGKWPHKWADGFENFGNGFTCVGLEKKQGIWRMSGYGF